MKTTPETPGQAATWTLVCNRARDFGLCHHCASQVAWGAQNGFTTVKPPCDACAVLIADLPTSKPQGWRVPAGSLSARETWLRSPSDCTTALSGTPGRPSAVVDIPGDAA